MTGGALSVTEFRSAQVLQLASDGSVASRSTLPVPDSAFAPHVAWRTVAGPQGATVSVYQEHSRSSLSTTTTGGYGDPACGPTVAAGRAACSRSRKLRGGRGEPHLRRRAPGRRGRLSRRVDRCGGRARERVHAGARRFSCRAERLRTGPLAFPDLAQVPIAVAFDANGDVLVQTRDPATLWVFGATPSDAGAAPAPVAIPLSTITRCDTGHDIFHTHAGAPIACASCHPEGGDDGHVWLLDGQSRRTPSLRGTIAGTAPYHWPGDEADLPTLVNDVYTVRMSGQSLPTDEMAALTGWVQALPPPPRPSWVDAGAVTRGNALFDRADVGCSSCHSGAKLTNNATVDVGTGGAFQVPPLLGVGWRAPFLHDGCARTIADRFTTCATEGHGNISALSSTDLGDLGAYLDSL